MKRNILMCALHGKNWIGGVYYIKNLLFQLSISLEANCKYNYFIFCDNTVISEFSELIEQMSITVVEYDKSPEYLLSVCSDYDIDVVLPITGGDYTWILKERCIYWIPDFQERHYPQNFAEKEIVHRKSLRKYIANEHKCLILSSKDAYNDYSLLYPENTDNVFVVHFVSYIGSLIGRITDDFQKSVMKKYDIEYQYIFVPNQFWKHKNHIVVLESLNKIIRESNKEIHVVFTGLMYNYGREDMYLKSIIDYIEKHDLKKYTHFLGMLEREEQLCIMKNATMVIQPSKFEGWGCSVEDAKVMGKKILLSDINVHKEQMYPKAILFPQDDSIVLSDLILNNLEEREQFDLEFGAAYMREKACQYAKELQCAIDSIKVQQKKNYLEILNNYRNEKVKQLFSGLFAKQICLYGIGANAQKLLFNCKQVLNDTKFVYSDSDPQKWGMEFEGGKVYPPSELVRLGVKRIIIASIIYQDDIYESIKKYEKDIQIIKIYNSEEDKNEPLWL